MEGSAEDGMKGVEVLRSRGLPSKVLDQVGVSGQFLILVVPLGKGSKPTVTESVRKGGGVPPLSVNFFPFGFWEPTVR